MLHGGSQQDLSVIGPLVVGLMADLTGNIRYGFLFLVFILWAVPAACSCAWTSHLKRGVSKVKGQETPINKHLKIWSGIIRGQIDKDYVKRDFNLIQMSHGGEGQRSHG